MLTEAQLKQFHEDGYLLIPDFFSADDCAKLKTEVARLLDEFDLNGHPMTRFSTYEENHTSDDYFLNSGDKIRFFFEEKAFENGKLAVPKQLAINKIGHALHELSKPFQEFSFRPVLKDIARQLEFKKPMLLQSMVIFKQPYIGGEVVPHQDSTFLHTNPLSAVGLWFALEDCTAENGCLEFIPGSHKQGIHNGRRFVRSPNGGLEFTAPPRTYPDEQFIPGYCKAGTLVLIHGSIIHRSRANNSPKSRHIYTFHMIEGEYEYDDRNWLQPTPEMPFSNLYESH